MNKVIQASIQDRQAYDTIANLIDVSELSPMDKVIYEHIHDYYETDPAATYVDVSIILEKVKRKAEKNSVFEGVVNYLESFEPVSVPNIIQEILEQKKNNAANELVKFIGLNRWDQVDKYIEKYQQFRSQELTQGKDEGIEYVGLPLDSIIESTNPENCIRLHPKSLNDAVNGHAMRGHHIGIFAVPETGKTLFVLNLISCMCHDGHKVLYVGNEDPIDQIGMRIATRFTNMSEDEIRQQRARAIEVANTHGAQNLVMVSMSPGSAYEIEEKILKHKPDVLVIDQLRNLDTGDDGLTTTLETASKMARRLAKKYNLLVVTVTQAADSATGTLVLDRSHIADSKIGYASQIDLLIGLGINDTYEQYNQLHVSLKGKNKLSGKHISFPVKVDKAHNKISSFE